MPHHHTLLAIDASTEQCSVALSHQQNIYQRSDLTPKSHAKVILPMVDDLLSEANVDLSEVAAFAVCIGPGSFTGIRIALSVCQGLAYGLEVPILTANSLETLAKSMQTSQAGQVDNECVVVPALDARMGEVYWAAYQFIEGSLTEVAPPAVTHPHTMNQFVAQSDAPCLGCGHGWSVAGALSDGLCASVSEALPNAAAALALLEARGVDEQIGAYTGFQCVEPLYLRNEVSWDKRKRVRTERLV